jgi:acyl-CoA reductase-like NAD-dependent aldehyde dehydrogenase
MQEHTKPDGAQLAGRYKRSWINGRLADEADEVMTHINPSDGSDLGVTHAASADDINAAVASARHAFEGGWGRQTAAQRKGPLLAFANAIAAHVEDLALLEALEVGRPLGDARHLISMAPDMLRRYVAMADHAHGDLIASEERQLAVSVRRPRGVVVAILPWNFPVMGVMMRLAPALAAGNAVIVKPSENAPRTAVLLAALASEAGLPDGLFNVVIGTGPQAGRELASHPDVDLVAFTGSTATGLAITRAAATSTLKPVLLECGGKSPQIVLDDAFDDPSIWGPIFFSSFWNSGQWCAARTRLLVPRSRLQGALAGLIKAAANWRLGDPLQEGTALGPLVNATQRARVQEFFASAHAQGEVVDIGCPSHDLHPAGHFVRPSVAVAPPRGSKVTREEVFGPLLSLEPFDDVADAIRLANDTPYGLMASIWTQRSDLAARLTRNVVAGHITVYSSGEAAASSAPDFVSSYFEPQKQSGHGVDGGLPGLASYRTAQAISWMT